MDKLRQINRIAFHIADRLLPAYSHCRWGNKVKNLFARNAFAHVGKNVNWDKQTQIKLISLVPTNGFFGIHGFVETGDGIDNSSIDKRQAT